MGNDVTTTDAATETDEARVERYAAIVWDQLFDPRSTYGRGNPEEDAICLAIARAILAAVGAETDGRMRAIEAAARAHVECLARYTTEAYCDDEERALRTALGLAPKTPGAPEES